MFTKRDCLLFGISGVLVASGFLLMAFDPAPYGFGAATLWVAPPLLLLGFFLPVLAITGVTSLSPRMLIRPRLQHLAGLLAFGIALITYVLTLEPTASLWDCSEFIASAYKLQVPHTPGTPLALLIGRIFTMFSFGNVLQVAWTLNFMSALFSALTVCLIYNIILHFGKALAPGRQDDSSLVVAALAGSLCLAFSDTFWFSAVEAETYGAACFFLLLLVWLILTGGPLQGPARGRRIIAIFYLAGLSYCIHPMCLLAIPLLPVVWGSSAKPGIAKGWVMLSALGLLIVLVINRFVAIGYFELAFTIDRVFVNSFALPFYSGVMVLVTATVMVFWYVLKRFSKARTYIWSVAFLFLGFLPYLLLFIRSNHDPPIDETNPENLAMIKAYMNRESYPTSPLVYGPYFDAKVTGIGVKGKAYYKDSDHYAVAGTLPEYIYNSRQTLLPRMYSNDENHIATYRSWAGLRVSEEPDFFDNLKFMVTYQLGHMYFRYLMWNFAGREGSEQNSSWIRPWAQSDAPDFEKARNQYWMIPLIVGMVGAIMQYRRDWNGFIIVTILFLITGVVLALYLNAPPNEPRERDYIYVGSFIAFCMWIGVGFYTTLMRLKALLLRSAAYAIVFMVPLWMFLQNLDDHNRSGRTFQVDHARNVLRSCAPNAILFTGGDNDTFPLWYVQEVEGFRTDVRVMVLSYMNTDWYIKQLRRAYYDSRAFNLTLTEQDYRQYGPNDVLYVQETITSAIDVRQYFRLLQKGHPALKMQAANGDVYHVLPSRTLRITGEKGPFMNTLSKSANATEDIILTITENYLSKNTLAILDLMISNGWTRPIYFNFTSLNSVGVDLGAYVVQEGPVFRLRGQSSEDGEIAVDTAACYSNLVELADYHNLSDSSVYFSYEDHFARMIVPLRHSFNALAAAFLKTGDAKMASEVMNHALEKLYPSHLPPSYTNIQAAEILFALKQTEQGAFLCKALFDYYVSRVNSQESDGVPASDLDRYILRRSAELLHANGDQSYEDTLSRIGI